MKRWWARWFRPDGDARRCGFCREFVRPGERFCSTECAEAEAADSRAW